MALGSSYSRVSYVIGRSVVIICGIGSVLALALSLAADHMLGSLLYGMDSVDAQTFATAAAGFVAVTMAAATAAILKIMRIEPARALKHE